MYAVIETGGKQYRVELGAELELDQLSASPGDTFDLGRVLLVADGDSAAIGRPVVDGARVMAEVLRPARGPKIVVFKYRPKARHRVKQGHRQDLTVVRIADIEFDGRSAAREARAEAEQAAKARAEAAQAAEAKAVADRALADKLARDQAELAAKDKADDAAATKGKAGAAKAGAAKASATKARAAKTAPKAAKPGPAAKSEPAGKVAKNDDRGAAKGRTRTKKEE